MKIPKEYGEKVKRYLELKAEEESLFNEVVDWLKEYGDADGICVERLFLTDRPTGELQNGDEYCDQHCGYLGDDFSGNYYHQIEGSDEYVGYYYWC